MYDSNSYTLSLKMVKYIISQNSMGRDVIHDHDITEYNNLPSCIVGTRDKFNDFDYKKISNFFIDNIKKLEDADEIEFFGNKEFIKLKKKIEKIDKYEMIKPNEPDHLVR